MNKNQKGFGAVELLIVLVAVGVIGFIGYVVWSRQSENKEQSTDNTSTSQSTSQKDKAGSKKDTLEIPELGVKLKLDDAVSDMYYAIRTDEDGNKYAVLSSKKLAELDKNCAAETDSKFGTSGVGSVYVYTNPDGPDPFTGDWTNAESFPDSIQVSGKYYTIIPSTQAPCYDADSMKDYDTNEVVKHHRVFKDYLSNNKSALQKL